ncbi:uncharacterized protein LOC124791708 [Schistocerca piceifrons]|uniref:uncharacterized protein LOC124791708 n=1 Tax=Schistocerca piceifrons TaxID=274613 RepID=UPI001F5F04A8|nr:uncharacterized protein LOC124791708 [Schistocerca piceifrons]
MLVASFVTIDRDIDDDLFTEEEIVSQLKSAYESGGSFLRVTDSGSPKNAEQTTGEKSRNAEVTFTEEDFISYMGFSVTVPATSNDAETSVAVSNNAQNETIVTVST